MERRSHRIRILIVDDHNMVRQGFRLLLNSVADMVVIGEASNGIEALDLCEQLRPDVVLMDIMMPEMDGITATLIIRHTHPNMKIVILTGLPAEEMHDAAMQAGAHQFLEKNAPTDQIITTVRMAYRGE